MAIEAEYQKPVKAPSRWRRSEMTKREALRHPVQYLLAKREQQVYKRMVRTARFTVHKELQLDLDRPE